MYRSCLTYAQSLKSQLLLIRRYRSRKITFMRGIVFVLSDFNCKYNILRLVEFISAVIHVAMCVKIVTHDYEPGEGSSLRSKILINFFFLFNIYQRRFSDKFG